MPLIQTIDKAFADAIGADGIEHQAFQAAQVSVANAMARLAADHAAGKLPLLGLPTETADLAAVEAAVADLKGASDVVFLGTGGSALGGQTLAQLAGWGIPGLGRFGGEPRVHFMDNLDPFTFEGLLAALPLATTRFVAISKSGGTGETLMQTMAAMAALRGAGVKGLLGKHFIGLSEPAKPNGRNALRALLEPEGTSFLPHHTGVGGRYSVLTNVGLLPAALLGLDIRALRAGAGAAAAPVLAGDPAASAAIGAALHLAAMREDKGIAVTMPYSDRLERFTRWWVQLWAESLGKEGKGSQPVGALGPVDQHSQQQLYLDGPRDKLFTVITIDTAGAGPRLDAALAERAGEPDFAGRTIGDLVAAQGRAMIETFARRGCAVRHMRIGALDAAALGELLMHFMLETILTGYAMGIDPFDQPAVEEAKILAKTYLAQG